MEYRNELKFEVSDITLEKIKYRLNGIMQRDAHQAGDSYLIRSIYFDDYQNSCFQENEAGVDERRKYRIRMYDAKADYISLEKKSKSHGMTKKEQAIITKDTCTRYIAGEVVPVDETMPPLLREFYCEQRMRRMRPTCIVEYERTAFVYPVGNVRITFDRNIRGSAQISSFYEPCINGIPVQETGHQILEVKYDEFLPTFILQALNIDTLRKQSFSKYYYVRERLNTGGMA